MSGTDSHPVPVSSSHVERTERGDPLTKPTQNPEPNENENHEKERRDPYSDIPEWLQEFRKNLVDDRVPEHRDSHASSSHEPSLEPTPTRSADLGKHSVEDHFPEDRSCEICQRTTITRAPCRRRIGGAVRRAEIFRDYHKVLSESCESRNNHRYAVVVQDLATQWIQSYLCKNKTSQETQRSLQKILEPERKPKVVYTDNSLEFGKTCEYLSWNHCMSTPHRSETKWDCWESSAQSKGRHLCCIVAIRSGWKLMGRFYGMLHLSAQRHRSIIWWEDALWKTFWRTT